MAELIADDVPMMNTTKVALPYSYVPAATNFDRAILDTLPRQSGCLRAAPPRLSANCLRFFERG